MGNPSQSRDDRANNSDFSAVDCQFLTTDGINFDSTTFNAQNMSMIGVVSTGDVLSLSGSTATIDGGSILNNIGTGASGPAPIFVPSGSKMTLKGNLTIKGNAVSGTQWQIENAGILSVESTVKFDCADIVNFFGTVTCSSSPPP